MADRLRMTGMKDACTARVRLDPIGWPNAGLRSSRIGPDPSQGPFTYCFTLMIFCTKDVSVLSMTCATVTFLGVITTEIVIAKRQIA